MRLEAKREVVTGGANGIGRATAAVFAAEGARVVIADIDRAAGSTTAETLRQEGNEVEFVAADMTRPDDVAALVAKARSLMGGIDVWVSNAGTSLTEDLLELEQGAGRPTSGSTSPAITSAAGRSFR